MPNPDPTPTPPEAGHVCSTAELGLWEPRRDVGYNAHRRPWVLMRRNEKWWGGLETMVTASFKERRFGSEAAAQKAADAANRPNTKLKDGHD